jgi:hypothetical protein
MPLNRWVNEKTSTYSVGNPDPCLGQVYKCGPVKPIKGIQGQYNSRVSEYWILAKNVTYID